MGWPMLLWSVVGVLLMGLLVVAILKLLQEGGQRVRLASERRATTHRLHDFVRRSMRCLAFRLGRCYPWTP
jgi:hypothetical protein